MVDQDTEGPDEKSKKKSDTTDDSNESTDSTVDSIDTTDSSDSDATTEPSTSTSETELDLPTDLQEQKSIARNRTPLRHGIIEDFPTLDNNLEDLQSKPKNWYGEGLNSGNSNDRYLDALAEWRHKYGHGLHSNHESYSNHKTHSNHQHHSEIGDNWQANDSSDGDESHDNWSSLHLKGLPHHHNVVKLEEESGKSHKKMHFGEELHRIGGKSSYSKNLVGPHAGTKNWGRLDLDSKHGGESHAYSYGTWSGVHLKPNIWGGLHSGHVLGDDVYISSHETLQGPHYNKNDVFSNGGGSLTNYNWVRSRSDS